MLEKSDFILFFYGLGFFILAAASGLLARTQRKTPFPWLWLALFSVVHGLSEWLDLIDYSLGSSPGLVIARWVMKAGSFVVLAEFARMGFCRRGLRLPGGWVLAPLLIIAATGAIAGLPALDATTRYTLALPAGLLAARVLWLESRASECGRRSLAAASLLMALYALAAGAIPRPADLFPAHVLNEEFFLRRLLVPVQLLRGLIACGMAMAVWLYYDRQRVHGLDAARVATRPGFAWAAGAALLAVVAIGWFMVEYEGARQQSEQRSDMLALARNAAASVDMGLLRRLNGTADDLGGTDYRQVKQLLSRMRQANPNCRFFYLLRQVGDDIVFLADSEPDESRDCSAPGSVYDDASDGLRQLFRNGTAFVEGPLPDDWGVWVSGIAPVRDPVTREIVAAIGIDLSAERYTAAIARGRFLFVTLTGLLSLACLGGILLLVYRRETAERIAASERQLAYALDATSDGVWDWDIPSGHIYFSPRWIASLGYEPHEVPPSPSTWNQLVHPEDLPHLHAALQTHLEGRTALFECDNRLRMRDGRWRPNRVRGRVVERDPAGQPLRMVGTDTDTTARVQMENELREAARIDRLTGLPNRALVLERLQQAIARSCRFHHERFAVLILDFDRFKIVNDSLGHGVGDLLLREISARLQLELQSDPTRACSIEHLAARLGGDEFAILLAGIRSDQDVRDIADRLLAGFARSYHVGEHEIFSTASIGIVLDDGAYDRAEDVLRDADTAMYEAKVAGKGRYIVFEPAMRQRVQARLSMETDLRRALQAGQFFLHYQPIVSLDSGELESFEALVRWTHPQRGLVSPAEFIPVAEDSGLVLPLGEWVLRESCRQFVQWQRERGAAAPRAISVNLSRIQLMLPDLPDRLHAIVQETGIDPAAVHLEITESAVMSDTEAAARALRQIRGIGFRIDMDDFGTGYSSLACLHQFPIDVLKIDRSFITNLVRGRDFAALVSAIATLARNLHIAVVAEGVENVEQVSMLQSLECQFAQGYYFGKPMPPEEAVKYSALEIIRQRGSAA